MCLKKDFFVLCPHKHWISHTVYKKDINKSLKNSCDCTGKNMLFTVIISEKKWNNPSGSRIYWGEKEE